VRFELARSLVCLALGLMFSLEVPLSGLRQEHDSASVIAWTKLRKLQWRDFAMKTPPRSSDDSLSWVGFDASWTCDSARFLFQVRTTFDPSQSWVKPGSQNDALLGHEQTHFDLTELAARRLRQQLAKLDDPCRSFMMMREIDRAIAAERQVWEKEQTLYDRETAYGTNAARQRFWERRTGERLDELNAFE